jgi:chemotaxis protein CheY-P-specific phosphatase CheC
VATQKKATDFTGRQREQLQAEAIEKQQEAANNMAMATAEAAFKIENEVLDATKPNLVEAVVVEDITTTGASGKTVVIRVAEDIESMTLGAGNYYTFKAGQKYEVTPEVAAHLEQKGYLATRY